MTAPDEPWVIWSYEHDGWWRPGGFGYTPDLAAAGHYARDDAARVVANANLVTVQECAMRLTDAKRRAANPPPAICCPFCGRPVMNRCNLANRSCDTYRCLY